MDNADILATTQKQKLYVLNNTINKQTNTNNVNKT
jgi:hypothetical protein